MAATQSCLCVEPPSRSPSPSALQSPFPRLPSQKKGGKGKSKKTEMQAKGDWSGWEEDHGDAAGEDIAYGTQPPFSNNTDGFSEDVPMEDQTYPQPPAWTRKPGPPRNLGGRAHFRSQQDTADDRMTGISEPHIEEIQPDAYPSDGEEVPF